MAELTREEALKRARFRRKWDNLVRGGLLGTLIAVLPLFFFPYSQDQQILPKEALAGTVLCAALAWWGWGIANGRKFRLQLGAASRGVGLLWLAHVVGWLVAWRAGSSLPLATERLAWVTGGLLFFLLLQDFARGRRKYLLALAWLVVLSGFLTACWVLWEDFGQWLGTERAARFQSRLGDWRGRLGAGLGNSGHIADWIALSFPPAAILLLRAKRKLLAAGLMAHLTLGAMALMVCWSVHSDAGLILGGLFTLGFLARHRPNLLRRKMGLIALQVLLWGAAVAFHAVPHALNPREGGVFREAFGSDRWKEGGSTRLVIWGGTLSMIRDRPLLGWGTGNFQYGYPQALNTLTPEESPLARYVGGWTNAAHNSILQAWAEMGLFGLVALLFLAGAWARDIKRALGRGNPFNGDARLVAAGQGLILLGPAMMSFPLQLPSFLLFGAALASVPLLLVDRDRELGDHAMEVEFQWPLAAVSLRGDGMIALRGVAFSLRLPLWARRTMVAGFGLAAAWGVWASGQCLASNVFYNRGYFIVQHRQGEPAEEALDAFESALKLRPGFADALSDRAKLRYRHAEWDEVLKDTEAALKVLQAPKLWAWRGEAFLRTGRKVEALQALATFEARRQPWAALREGPVELGGRELKRLQGLAPATAYANF